SDHDPQIARFQSRAAVSVGDATVDEGDSGRHPMSFPVTLSRPVDYPVTICASAVHGTALPVLDYELFFGCRLIRPGETTAELVVQVRGDRRKEPNERFTLVVGSVTPGVRTTDGIATGTITDDD
ncbi:endonuclease, partial [Actinoplanes sp. NPDC051633]